MILIASSFLSLTARAGNLKKTCLQAAHHISGSNYDENSYLPISPRHFNYRKVKGDIINDYNEYFLGNNPSLMATYRSLLKGLSASFEAFYPYRKYYVGDHISSFKDVLDMIHNLKTILNSRPRNPKFIKFYVLQYTSIQSPAMIKIACASAYPYMLNSCSQAVSYLIKSSERSGTNLGDTLYKKHLSQYLERKSVILNKIALHFLELIEDHIKFGKLPSKDVYQEILTLLQTQFKLSDHSSRKIALEVLAVFSTRGAEWFHDGTVRSKPSSSSLTSIMIITSAIQYFDKITFHKNGKQFSIPKEIITTCYYAKPYHFWLAAYMAFDAERAGYSKKVSLAATHLIGVGYELARFTGEGYNHLAFDQQFLKSTGAQAVRNDLVFNSLGAWFGVSGSDKMNYVSSINGDKALSKLVAESKRNSKHLFYEGLTEYKEISFYLYFSPNAHLNSLLNYVETGFFSI